MYCVQNLLQLSYICNYNTDQSPQKLNLFTLKPFILLMFLFISNQISSQIEGVAYQLAYDGNTNKYYFLLHITKGRAELKNFRYQGNSQISIVTPKDAKLNITNSYKPSVGGDARTPANWVRRSTINGPLSAPTSQFFSITPDVSPTAFYDTLGKGDVIQLFAFEVSPKPTNFEDVRLFDNEKDPKSSSPGMGGADFSQSFSVGPGGGKFVGNIGYGLTSLSSESYLDEVRIYPNPTNGFLQIKSNSAIDKVEVKTMDGKILISSDQILVDMSTLLKGIYVVDVYVGKNKYTRRIIRN
jgi:hypothetical protein